MKNNYSRMAAMLCAAVLVLAMLPPSALAAEDSVPGAEAPLQAVEGVEAPADEAAESVTSAPEASAPPVQTEQTFYVSASGDDANDGTEGAPFATLAKAVDAGNQSEAERVHIIVMTDLAVASVARIKNKDMTLTSYDQERPVTLTRGDTFAVDADIRLTYNPAMIEVTVKPGGEASASLEITHITLDDAQKTGSGTIYQFQTSNGSGGNENKVQDAIVAAYSAGAALTLGDGAVLANHGGMSAVRVTGGASVVMKSGSVISGGPAADVVANGGAIVSQSGAVEMQEGAAIREVIHNKALDITGGTLLMNGTVEDCTYTNSGNGSIVRVGDTDLEKVQIGPTGVVRNNTSRSNIACVWLQRGAQMKIYGKIIDNSGGAGLYLISHSGNEANRVVTLEEGGEISGNSGYGVALKQGQPKFIMNGGTIANNGSCGVFMDKGSEFRMNGGAITGNGTGLWMWLRSDQNSDPVARASLKGGSITGNRVNIINNPFITNQAYASSTGGWVEVTADAAVGNKGSVDLAIGSVRTEGATLPLWLGNAQPAAQTYLQSASRLHGWNTLGAALYYKAGTDEVRFAVKPSAPLDTAAPVYGAYVPLLANGTAAPDAEVRYVRLSAADGDGSYAAALPGSHAEGYAFALAQRIPNTKSLQITGPDIINERANTPAYDVPYTVKYTLSQADVAVFEEYRDTIQIKESRITVTVALDSMLTVKTDDKGQVLYTFASPVLEVKDATQSAGMVVFELRLKQDWTENIASLGQQMTLSFTGVLNGSDFKAPGMLCARAESAILLAGTEAEPISEVSDVFTTLLQSQKFMISYDANGGSGTMGGNHQTYLGGDKVAVLYNGFTRSGHTFSGWNTNPGGGGTAYAEGAAFLMPETDLVLYAQWTRQGGGSGGGGGEDPKPVIKYTLTFVTNGGGKVATEEHPEGTQVPLTQTTSWEGHEFLGWYSDVRLTRRVASVTMTGNKTVYAKWYPGHDVVPDLLNGDDHYAYIMGFEDGTVRPGANITRAEVATIFFRLLKDDVRADNLMRENGFTDVTSDSWYNTAVSTAARLGLVKGRDTGAFDPAANITRAEFAAIAARFDSAPYAGEDQFGDIAGSWAREEINRAAARGWVMGDENGNFRPNDYITRAEAVTLINRILNRDPADAGDLLPGMNAWPDNMDTAAWYYLAVQEAGNSHEFERRSDGTEKWTKLNPGRDWSGLES